MYCNPVTSSLTLYGKCLAVAACVVLSYLSVHLCVCGGGGGGGGGGGCLCVCVRYEIKTKK